MLLHQAAPGFESWFGVRPEVDADLRAAVLGMTLRPYRLGLTGSIGMGKSTTARLFAAAGVPVWDADEAVHRRYAVGGGGAEAIRPLAPSAVVDGVVDRDRLRAAILADPDLLARIEAAIHPLVAADRAAFLAIRATAPLVLLDIPLLYETGAETSLDGVLVVTAPPHVQRTRVLARARHDRRRLSLASTLARSRTPKSDDGPISSSRRIVALNTPAPTF